MATEEEIWFAAQRDADNDDEDYDEELLRNVPCANDDAPVMSFHNPFEPLLPTPAQAQDTAIRPTTAHRLFTEQKKKGDIGICDIPPLSCMSFMMRGDNGVVRWLTASGLDTKRKRQRENDTPMGSMLGLHSYNVHLPDNDDHNCDDNNDNDDDEDSDGPQQIARELRQLRGGADSGLGLFDIPALLQQMYEDAARATETTRRDPPAHHSIDNNSNGSEKKQNNTNVENALWVTKYSPRRFRELLSDDTINLRVLQWLKTWDAYVFHGLSAERPEERLAVLVGPPGVGKTTLAHVLATHCGYEAIEINASVDRTASKLEAAIQLAVAPSLSRRRMPFEVAKRQSRTPNNNNNNNNNSDKNDNNNMDSISNNNNNNRNEASLVDRILRPKCLIIDEIDGISANVANFLLKQDIHCPVFCLCNDFYVPSLRPLRRSCQHVYHFPPLRPQRLMSRLEEITEREGFALAQPLLADLAQSSNGDVRCCLNTLQFLYHQAANASSSVADRSLVQVMREMQGKDAKLGLWDAWRTVLQREERGKYIQLLRKECAVDYEAITMAAASQHTDPQEKKQKRRTERVSARFRVDPGYMYVSRVVQQCADTATFVDGLQEYYLQRPYADYTFQRTLDVADAFSCHDRLVTAAYRSDGASAALFPFIDSSAHTAAALCFAHCASAGRAGPLGFPRESADGLRRLSESAHIARSFREGCRGAVAAHLCSDAAVACDTAPLLLRCLVDSQLRPAAHPGAAVGPRERQLFAAAAARFAEYGLTYTRAAAAAAAARRAVAWGKDNNNNNNSNDDDGDRAWELAPPLHRIGGGALNAKRGAGGVAMAVGMKEELKQIMVAEIQRSVLQNGSPHAAQKNAVPPEGIVTTVIRGVKGKNEESMNIASPALSTTTDTAKTTVEATVSRKRERKEETTDAAGQEANPKPTVKRDFFGRPIAETGKKMNAKTGSGTSASASARGMTSARTKVTVQYTYHDGSTNAVRIPAAFDDF